MARAAHRTRWRPGEPYTRALLILWKENPGTEGIFRAGSCVSTRAGTRTLTTRLRSGSGPTITAGWHTMVRVWDGQQVRQYVDGLRTKSVAVTATGGWTIYKWGWQFSGSQALDEAFVPLFGAFGAAWGAAMVARWSACQCRLNFPQKRRSNSLGAGMGGDQPAG